MLVAAAALIAERGFSETRIADVARRVGASPALVIYYFGTKDQLLTEALRYSETSFYASCTEMLASTPGAARPAREPGPDDLRARSRRAVPGRRGGCGSTCGRRRSGTPQVAQGPRRARPPLAHARSPTSSATGVAAGEIAHVDADEFAVTWGVLLDGLSIQVALKDESVDSRAAPSTIAMQFAERELGLDRQPRRRQLARKGRSAARRQAACRRRSWRFAAREQPHRARSRSARTPCGPRAASRAARRARC